MRLQRIIGATAVAFQLQAAVAGGGPLGIDHQLNVDNSGIWARRNQTALQFAGAAAAIGGALWFGNDDPLGHTFWQSVDSMVLGNASAQVLKPVFGRARPTQTDDPNQWFKGSGHNSFPSGEVAHITSVITPFVLEYGDRHPLVYALELLPLYDAVARMKVRAHWQTDVLGGFALGTASGYYAHTRDVPFMVKLMPRGVSVGWSKSF